MKGNYPLVSLVVITYNSSQTILETLDSMKVQDYPNLELIVSDDCSKDNTVEIVQNWLEVNSPYFQYTALITSPVNTGVCANLNRGIRASHGEWIKSLAGDDKLKPNAIERFVNIALSESGRIYCCDLDVFGVDGVSILKYRKMYDFYFSCVSESLEKQKERILKEYTIPGPGWFYSRSLYDEIDGFDEKYCLMEEWPFIYKCLERNIRINPISEKLIDYRISATSLCHKKENGLIPEQLFDDQRKFFYAVRLKDLLKKGYIKTVFLQIKRYEIAKVKHWVYR